jgi:hypothetical protein
LKKINKFVSKEMKNKGIENFSIINNTQTKNFMKSDWKGFDLINNQYYPKGFVFEK